MSESILKPCPFCGGMAYRHELIEHYPASADGPAGSYSAWFHIGCNVCGIEVGDEYESSAIAAWNQRAESDLLQMLHECAEYIAALNGEQDDYCRRARALIARATGEVK